MIDGRNDDLDSPLESATFETRPVRRRRARSPIVILASVAVLAGVVAIGTSGRPPSNAARPDAAGSLASTDAAKPVTVAERPGRTNAPDSITLSLVTADDRLSILGDVYASGVVSVFV